MAFIFMFLAFVLMHTTIIRAALLPQSEHFRRQGQSILPPPANIPAQCRDVCGPPQSTLNTCNPPVPSCICTQVFQSGLFNCFGCLGQSINATDYSTVQGDIDQVTTSCDQAGHPLPKKTFPGQNPNRPLMTSATVKATTTSQRSTAHASSSAQSHTTPRSGPTTQPAASSSTVTTAAQSSLSSVSTVIESITNTSPASSTTTATSPGSSAIRSFGAYEGMTALWTTFAAILVGVAIV